MVVMEGGRLVQVSTTQMNELPGQIVRVRSGAAAIALSDGVSLTVLVDSGKGNAGESITLGIRPEHLAWATISSFTSNG